jgi:drug/metabolite transporter (DMT)-like permease
MLASENSGFNASLPGVQLFTLISRKTATRLSSLFFLMSPTTAIVAWLLFGEAISGATIAGMAFAAFGVSLAVAG